MLRQAQHDIDKRWARVSCRRFEQRKLRQAGSKCRPEWKPTPSPPKRGFKKNETCFDKLSMTLI